MLSNFESDRFFGMGHYVFIGPLSADQLPPEPLGSESSIATAKRVRILVADDHQSVLERAVLLLQPYFEIVGTASNGNTLVESALRLQPDVIVSDVVMPEINGLEAAHRIRATGSTAKFVFLSVYERNEFATACFSEGGSAYVTKARMNADLVRAVNEVIDGRQFVSPSVRKF